MVRDMTKGSPIRLLIVFAAPLLLGNIFQQLYSVVDAVILGRGVGVNALAAAGSTGALHFFVFGFINGLTHGFSIKISQAFGAGSETRVRQSVANAAWLSVFFAVLITLLSLVFSEPLLRMLQTPENIFHDALLYIRIIFVGICTTVFYNILASILRALGDSVTPLVVVVVSSLVNVGLDVLFVMVLQWGVAGAAWATVLSQLFSGVLCLFALRRLSIMRFQKGEARLQKSLLCELMKLGLPVGVMNSVTAVGNMLLQTVVNGFGEQTVAAYTTGTKILSLAEQPGVIIGMSLGTYVGQNMGAGKIDRIRLGVRKAILLCMTVSCAVGAVMVFFGRQLVESFVSGTEQAVIEASYPFLFTCGAMMWVLGLLFVYRYSLQNLGDTTMPMVSGALELVLRIAVVLLLYYVFHMDFLAVCIAEVSAWAGAMLLLCVTYYVRMRKNNFPALKQKG